MFGLPQRTGSGSALRFYSNCRAYMELGFEVEVIEVLNEGESDVSEPHLPVAWTRVAAAPPERDLIGRLFYRLGYPAAAACAYYFPRHATVLREAVVRERRFPGSLHQFEHEDLATVLPFLPGLKAIWGCHDIPSALVAGSNRIDRELGERAESAPERRQVRFLGNFERMLARRSRLILCISRKDCETIRSEWHCANAEYLPMSIPDAPAADRANWLNGGNLTLLHVGSLSHLPTYRSIEFLMNGVLPSLRPEILEKISIRIAGHIHPSNPRCERVLEMCSRFRQVRILGRVPDLKELYATSDLQLVASTEATGLRTRIVESFAYGLPVLSTSVAADGIAGLRDGENILLADSPESFARKLEFILDNPGCLPELARHARATYDTLHSPGVVASSLGRFLAEYFNFPFAALPRQS
jgi:glycosyltransferase involved in cell wall biosynthesis